MYMRERKYVYGIKHFPMFIRLYMKYFGFYGLTTYWTIYYVDEDPHPRLIIHEDMHRQQMDQEGFWRFHIKYMYYWVTRGYQNNPYEIEAREAEKTYL